MKRPVLVDSNGPNNLAGIRRRVQWDLRGREFVARAATEALRHRQQPDHLIGALRGRRVCEEERQKNRCSHVCGSVLTFQGKPNVMTVQPAVTPRYCFPSTA